MNGSLTTTPATSEKSPGNRRGQHVRQRDRLAGFPNALVGRHEEGLIATDRAANHSAELLPIELGLRRGRRSEVVPGIEAVAADVVEGRSVEGVAAGLQLQLHVRAGMPAVSAV